MAIVEVLEAKGERDCFQKDRGQRCQTLQRGYLKELVKVPIEITFGRLLGL